MNNLILYITILILAISCKKIDKVTVDYEAQQSESVLDSIFNAKKFTPATAYKPLSIMYKGKSMFTIGQNRDAIEDSKLSYRPDSNSEFMFHFPLVRDFLSLDDNFSFQLTEGYISGMVFFSTDEKEDRLFAIGGSWTLVHSDEHLHPETIDSITTTLFPILKDKLKIENNWEYKHKTPHQIEYWKVTENEERKLWHLAYEVTLK